MQTTSVLFQVYRDDSPVLLLQPALQREQSHPAAQPGAKRLQKLPRRPEAQEVSRGAQGGQPGDVV